MSSFASSHLRFEPIDFVQHSDVCIKFREDSFIVSFGDSTKFYEDDRRGGERYLEWLKAKANKDLNSAVHIWLEDKIIGQIELGKLREDASRGYVNLYYLIPEVRGRGLGAQLDAYAVSYFRKLGLSFIRLSVSPTNAQAMAYYKKMGWKDLGPRPGHPEVHFMEKNVL